jgi:hypothetical protein
MFKIAADPKRWMSVTAPVEASVRWSPVCWGLSITNHSYRRKPSHQTNTANLTKLGRRFLRATRRLGVLVRFRPDFFPHIDFDREKHPVVVVFERSEFDHNRVRKTRAIAARVDHEFLEVRAHQRRVLPKFHHAIDDAWILFG